MEQHLFKTKIPGNNLLTLSINLFSVIKKEDQHELSDAEIKMLEERLADYEANPESGNTWEDVMERLTLSFKKEDK